MPQFLERKLDKEYPNEPTAKYKIMNKIGAIKGNKETAKGKAMEKKHKKHALKKVFEAHRSQMNVINKHLE